MKLIQLVTLAESSGNANDLVAYLEKLPSVSEVDSDNGAIDVFTKKNNSARLVWRKNTWEATVTGYDKDIDVGDIGSTPKEVAQFIKEFDSKKWFKENDPDYDD